MFKASAQITGRLKVAAVNIKKGDGIKIKMFSLALLEFELSMWQVRFQLEPDEWVPCCLGRSMGLWLWCFLAWVTLL